MELYAAMPSRADALFELVDAVLCAAGPVVSLPELSLEAVHRRGHGAMYDALANGRIDVGRLQLVLAGLELPRGVDRQLSIAVDVTPWPRPDAECSPQRLHCYRPCRCDGVRQTIPGWPYQVAAALGGGRSSWTGVLDAVRIGPDDDPTEVTAAQIHDLLERLRQAGQWREGDPEVLPDIVITHPLNDVHPEHRAIATTVLAASPSPGSPPAVQAASTPATPTTPSPSTDRSAPT
jgi:hypothetical protein